MKAKKLINKIARLERAAHHLDCSPQQVKNFISAGYFPQPRQLQFHAAARLCDLPDGPTQIGFGGARGPGKSHAALAQTALDDCRRFPDLKVLYIRRYAKQAREQFDDLRRTVLRNVPHRYIKSEGLLIFPNGSRISVGHIRTENDIDQYLGIEYDVILIEEATTLSETKMQALRDSNRTSKNFRPRIYTTTNPGGIGHVWYKKRFVDPFRNHQELDTRFVPATIEDNAVIDPDYRRKLEENTGWKLRAHRYGDWEIAAGQFLDNFNYDLHVIEPFPIPSEWHCFMGMDYGYKHPTVFLLLAEDGDDNLYVLDEHVQSGWLPQQHAKAVHAMIERNGAHRATRDYIFAGADVFAQKSQFTIADYYLDEGLAFTKADTDRVQGAHELRARLGNPNAGIPPSLFIFNRCSNLIECLPNLQNDPKNPEDVLKVDVNEEGIGGDDTYDALRYAVFTNIGSKLAFA